MKLKLWALSELLKRHRLVDNTKSSERDLVDCLMIIMSENATWYQKRAARIVLDWNLGVDKVNELIKDVAIVDDRNDRLVRMWRNEVIKRDGHCKRCGSSNKLHAHHISHWSDDPINRIKLENGITLCDECHANEHPELSSLILSVR